MHRREFLKTIPLAAIAGSGSRLLSGENVNRGGSLRAAIIGHTGRGNYGHDLDLLFNGFENIVVAAVADPDEKGRKRAAERSGALRHYADYREMLAREKPQLVSIAPRWSDQHFEMARAAMAVGAHVCAEKPFTQSLVEADALLAMAEQHRLKIAVAHQMRLAPGVTQFKEAVAGGILGDLVHIRSWGKQDRRAGGEDLIVLGTHIFDMIRFFAGDAVSCTAQVWHQGVALKKDHARRATEDVGPVAGDEIEAQFMFERNVTAPFTGRGDWNWPALAASPASSWTSIPGSSCSKQVNGAMPARPTRGNVSLP
jgi:predicted dehydrogenase